MKKRILAYIFAIVITACFALSCKGGTSGTTPGGANVDSVSNAFVKRSYWMDDMNTRLTLSFYYVDKPFAKEADDIEKCTIGNGSDMEYDCKVVELSIADEPLYTVDKTKYYNGRLVIEVRDMKASIGDTVITIKVKDGEPASYPIGNISYTKIDETANKEAMQFIEYALVNPALYSENGRPKVAALAVEMSVLKDVTITRFSSDSDKFGFDIHNSKVYSYDEYMSTLSAANDNMELDSLIPGIYNRKVVERKEVSGEIELKAGRYVVIVPMVQYESEIFEPAFTGLDIAFAAYTGSYMLHVNCNPTVVENFHTQDEVIALFSN